MERLMSSKGASAAQQGRRGGASRSTGAVEAFARHATRTCPEMDMAELRPASEAMGLPRPQVKVIAGRIAE
jgi:hypothetical protein